MLKKREGSHSFRVPGERALWSGITTFCQWVNRWCFHTNWLKNKQTKKPLLELKYVEGIPKMHTYFPIWKLKHISRKRGVWIINKVSLFKIIFLNYNKSIKKSLLLWRLPSGNISGEPFMKSCDPVRNITRYESVSQCIISTGGRTVIKTVQLRNAAINHFILETN